MMSIEELVDLEVSGWNPEPGDKLVGVLIDRRDGVEGGYDPYTMLVIQTGEHEATAVHCFHSALRGEVERQDPRIGDQVAVKFLGERPTKGQSKFASFQAYNFALRRSPENEARLVGANTLAVRSERFTPSGQSEHERKVAEHNAMVERTQREAQGEVRDVDQSEVPWSS